MLNLLPIVSDFMVRFSSINICVTFHRLWPSRKGKNKNKKTQKKKKKKPSKTRPSFYSHSDMGGSSLASETKIIVAFHCP